MTALAIWLSPFSLYRMVRLDSTWVDGVTSRMMSESSRMVVMKVSKKPDTNPGLVRGKMIRLKRCQALASATSAASSSSRPTCNMADTPERAEYGMCLATETITSRANVPYRAGMGPKGFANIEM